MPTIFNYSSSSDAWKAFYLQLISPRKVRNIVTVSGRGARGRFPSYKAPKGAKFESLVEEALLRVLEVSTLVKTFETQPCVFQLPGENALRYTPDARAEICDQQAFFEAKHDGFRKSKRGLARLKEVCARMRDKEVRLAVVLESELRDRDIQQALAKLLRDRPAPGRYRKGLDTTEWDPFGREKPDAETLRRWQEAQRECDALLRRIMGRNPDDLFVESN